jgi:hypothetical protein
MSASDLATARLQKILECSSVAYLRDTIVRNSCSLGNLPIGKPDFTKVSHLYGIRHGDFSSWMAKFFRHIILIVCICAKKQMRWANTFSIVAMMANKFIVRCTAISAQPSKSMSGNGLSPKSERTISGLSETRSSPFPTVLGLINLRPKSTFVGTPTLAIGLSVTFKGLFAKVALIHTSYSHVIMIT